MRTVRDVMQTDIIGVRKGTSAQELVELLDEEGISGVPVLDTDDRVLGVVSRTDVVRMLAKEPEIGAAEDFWEMLGRDATGEADDPGAYFLSPESGSLFLPASQTLQGNPAQETPVEDIMTPVAFNVDPGMTVPELAHFLVSGKIHRALVLEGGRLVGIVTAFDVLRAVAAEVPEGKAGAELGME